MKECFKTSASALVIAASLTACASTSERHTVRVGYTPDTKTTSNLYYCPSTETQAHDNGTVTCKSGDPEKTIIPIEFPYGGNGKHRNMLLQTWVPSGTDVSTVDSVKAASLAETNPRGEKEYSVVNISNDSCSALWNEMINIQNGGRNIPQARNHYYPAELMVSEGLVNKLDNYAYIGQKLIETAYQLPSKDAQQFADDCGQKMLQFSYIHENESPATVLGNKYHPSFFASDSYGDTYNGRRNTGQYNIREACAFASGRHKGSSYPSLNHSIVNGCQAIGENLKVTLP